MTKTYFTAKEGASPFRIINTYYNWLKISNHQYEISLPQFSLYCVTMICENYKVPTSCSSVHYQSIKNREANINGE